MSDQIVITDHAKFQAALTALSAVKVPSTAAATTVVAAAEALPLEEGVTASPALAAIGEVMATLTADGAATAEALAAAIAEIATWRDDTDAIQHGGATGVQATG